MARVPVPYLIRRVDEGRRIEIQWDQAGHAGLFDARQLRLACQCAACVEEMSGRPMLDPASVPALVQARAVRLVGAYAAHFEWSDGHSTGIYPWERLLAACPCPACTANRSET
jgi:ATP-binding protein involved in chromosome partitioning